MSPATPRVDASAIATPSGSIAMAAVGAATIGAQPPAGTCATTRVPWAGPLPSAAVRSTCPATSWPGRQPSRGASSRKSSPRLTE